VLTNWKREATGFTPELTVLEHYGPRRPATPAALAKALKGVDLVLTSYGLLQRDSELLASMDWQGTVSTKPRRSRTLPPSNPWQPVSWPGQQNQPLPHRPHRHPRWRNRVSELVGPDGFPQTPTVLGDEEFFRQRYRLPIERYGDTAPCATSRPGWAPSFCGG